MSVVPKYGVVSLPFDVREQLKPLDLNGDGTIDVSEVVAQKEKETAKQEEVMIFECCYCSY